MHSLVCKTLCSYGKKRKDWQWYAYSYLFVGKNLCSYRQNRKDGVSWSDCTIHGRFTHSYLLAKLIVLTVKIAKIGWSWSDCVLFMVGILIVICCQNLCSYGQNRKEQVVLTRCRTGHGIFTHGNLLNNEEWPECIPYTDSGQKYSNASNFPNIFYIKLFQIILKSIRSKNMYLLNNMWKIIFQRIICQEGNYPWKLQSGCIQVSASTRAG